MKLTKYLSITLVVLISSLFHSIVFSQCNVQASVCESNSLSQAFAFNQVGTAYAGGSFANAGCNTGAAGNHAYGFISLYITSGGPLNLLIDGNSNWGYIDVAIFRVPNGQSPCDAILNGANAIGCNYAEFDNGCVQFGNQFPCISTVTAPIVNAGDQIMIVAQSFTAGESTTFNLSLAPVGAATGIPNATIDVNSLGPYCTTDGLMQVQAANMGGTWSGTGMQANGMFNPASAGAGVHTINYSIGVAPCNASASSTITVGSIALQDINVGICQTNAGYAVSGNVNILNPPATGDLVVADCSGAEIVVQSAPFTTGSYPFTINGLTSANTDCSLYAYFTDGSCSHLLNYSQPICNDVCGISFNNVVPTGCVGANIYSVGGVVALANAPATGQLILQNSGGGTLTFNAPFPDNITFNFNDLIPNGIVNTITATFTEQATCSSSSTYQSPTIPTVTAGADVSICTGNATTIGVSGSASSYSWSNGGSGTSISVNPTATTTYIVTGTSNGCTASDEIIVTVNSNLIPTITPSQVICIGQSASITASGGVSYSWTGANGSSPTINVNPTTTTTYIVTATDANGCSGTAQTTITVNALPVVLGEGTEICADQTATLIVSGAQTYSWTPTGGLSTPTGSEVIFTPGQTTNYTVVGTDENGCTNSTIVTVTVNPLPIVDAGNAIVGCEGDEIVLSATGAGVNGTYVWSNGEQNDVPFSATAGVGQLTVVATTNKGCSSTGTVNVNIEPLPLISFSAVQDQRCKPVVTQFTNLSSNAINYVWYFDNGEVFQGDGPVTQVFSHSGVYGATVEGTSTNGCTASLHLDNLVTVDEDPIAAFIPYPAIFQLSSPTVRFNNQSVGATSYVWDFGNENQGSSEENPSYTYPGEVAAYNVTLYAFSAGGCVDTFEYAVQSQEDLLFYIPNSFTPDGNEYNQVFQPVFTSGFDPYSYTMLIFNRWGEPIYETHDTTVGWKGTYGENGNDCQEGTYTWKIEFRMKYTDERKMYTGHVNLLK